MSKYQEPIVQLAHEVLLEYASNSGGANRCEKDAGPAVLASVLLGVDSRFEDTAQLAVERWLDELPEQFNGIGPFGGLGGFLAAMRAAMTFAPAVKTLYQATTERTEDWLRRANWRSSGPAWSDYDFFTGPSGVILAGAAPGCSSHTFERALRHLRRMCTKPDLEAFRAGDKIDRRSAFNIGRINTGLAHGLAGVASALRHAIETFDDASDCLPALRGLCDRLVLDSYVDSRGLISWPMVSMDGAPAPAGFDRRQAWCYGTPGVAWALFDASRILEDADMALLAQEAMRTFCELFEENLYIDAGPVWESLSICHGAAGTLAVADAFEHHSTLLEPAKLSEWLSTYLLGRSDDIRTLAMTDMTMLSGAGGIMSVLLTASGADRTWLPQIALR